MANSGTKGVARADRERQLVLCAVEEFGRQGYAGASTERVAQAAGVSKGMVYHLFGSKEGLSRACLEAVGPDLVDAVTAAQESTDPRQRALDTLTAIFTALAENRHAWAVIYDPTLPDGPAGQLAAGFRKQLEALGTDGTRQILTVAGDHDALDHELLDRMWQSAVATAVRWWQTHDELSAEEMATRCARLLGVLMPPVEPGGEKSV
ncbi:TetR/AcrR family transcriptional regulator [Nocardioides daphniae]|uniref:TetR family transcriptional regulator n=1 Tax=Nocardioides daphniae TaxID=402297 RepID=A0ABQ1QKM5_9ACTN|nr:TetR/AcrR family transcriptional regulator [Nocardioides daphniae]GGD30542.1 TetR family transcriptional regulator [Nocardioides daphniae]